MGNYLRSNRGELGGTTGSRLILGNGEPTTNDEIHFEDGVMQLTDLIIQAPSVYNLRTPLEVENLTLVSGTLNTNQDFTISNSFTNSGSYIQTSNSTFFNKTGGGIINISGSGNHTFWIMVIDELTTVATSDDIQIHLHFTSNSNAGQGFVADAGTVFFSRNGNDHYIQGEGTGSVVFDNLTFNGTGNKYLARSFEVKNLFHINNGSSAVIDNSAAQNFEFNNLTVGQGSSGRFIISGSGALSGTPHSLTIHGLLEVRSGGQFSLHSASNRYGETEFTGNGTVLQGSGSFIFQSVILSGVGPRQFNTSSTLSFYRGDLSENHFTNNSGTFQTANSLFYFRDHDVDWEIRGDGDIEFYDVQIGANTRTNAILQRDLTVNGNLIFNMNTTSNHLDINGFSLTLNGNHTRSRNGRIRGGSGSELIIAGAGNHTSSFLFDETIDGQTNLIDSFIMDLEENGELRLGNLVYIENLQALNGTFNAFNGSIHVNEGGSANFQQAYFIDNNNSGQNTFLGTLIIEEDAVFNPSANSVLNLGGILNNMGEFLKEGSGNVNFIENTIVQGDEPFYFINGNLFISENITVINQVNTDTIGVLMNGRLNGSNPGSVWDNRSFLTYQNGNEPMTIGQLVAVHSPNTVIYSREDNDQDVKGTFYHHLIFTGSGNRSMQEHLSVNGDMLIDQNTTLLTREFQITGNPTGKLIMREESEMVIGRNTAQIAGFPELFIRDNIELDPISLVRYDGHIQTISHIPVYSNLAITRASGDKTLGGDVTVNGYLHITSGTLAFGSAEKQTLTVYGDLIGAGGRINMSVGAHAHEMHLYGTVNQVNRFNYAPGTSVKYLSSQAQQIFSPNSSDHYSMLEIAGGAAKWLEGNIRINDELRLTSGRLRLGDFNLILYNADVTGVFGPNAMVETNGEGFLEKSGTGGVNNGYLTGLYPVGSGGRYSPVNVYEIAGSHANNRYFRVKAVPERHQSIVQSYDALVRFWEIETNAGTRNARMEMYFSPTDVIGDPILYKAYKWTGSEFVNYDDTQVYENYIEFSQPLPVEGQWTAFDDETIRETFYSYMDGPWSELDTWTTDPSGQLLIGSQVPGASDNAVILPGRTVHLEQNIDAKGVNIEIRNSAILDLGEYVFTQVVSTLKGEGTLKLATNQMPIVALNLFVQPEGGTVEYNVPDASFELNEQEHYNHLTINLPEATNKAILVNNLEVYGNLRVDKGILQIYRDDATENTHVPVIVDVYNDIHVGSEGAFFTGTASTSNGQLPPQGTFPGSLVPRYYDIYHKLYVGGGFYNNGQVRFFSEEITVPDFENLTDGGAVTVRFYGDENTILECNGITDFYNLIIDKGEGPAAEMELVAEQPQFFRLFGANVYNAGSGGNNPEVRKALWIRNGTLRLTGNTTLASLTEGRGGSNNSSWIIPANAALILDSPGATVLVTADTPNEVEAAWGVTPTGVHKENFPQELLVLGSLIVNQGYLSTRMSGGIIIARAGGEVIVNGGKVSARQMRSADQGGSVFSFRGGEIELPGRYHHFTQDIISIEDIRNTPIDFETDNTLRLHGTATFNLNRTVDVFEMSGGTLNIYNTSGGGGSRALRIMSDEANMESTGGNINIFIRRNTQHDIEVPHGIIPNMTIHKEEDIGNNGFVRLLSPLRILRDLSLSGFARLNVNTQNYNVSVGRNFTINSEAAYIPRQNTTVFDGSVNGVFRVDGEIADGLYNLTVQKLENRSLIIDGENGDISVRRLLSLQSGFLNDGGKTITVQRDIFNSAQHNGSGRILLSGASVNRVIDGDGNGEFGNLELDDSPLLTSTLAASQKVNGNFTLTNGILHLANNELRLERELLPSDPLHYSISRMVMTAGNTSDAGLIFRIDENRDYHFPLGTDRDDMTRYTPAIATISDFAEEGYLRVNPVGHELPTLNQESDSLALQYFWRIRNEGFDSTPNVAWVFHYDENDVPVEDHLGNPVENADENFVPGKVVGAIRSFEETGVDAALNTITFPPHAMVNGSYTAAEKDRFEGEVPVFYSNVANSNWYSYSWHNADNWSNVSHAVGAPKATRHPGPGDIVYIGYWNFGGSSNNLHSIIINANMTAECAELHFQEKPDFANHNSRLVLRTTTSAAKIDQISGAGTLEVYVRPTQQPFIEADFGDFISKQESEVIYYLDQNGTIVIDPIFDIYPNLRFTANNFPDGSGLSGRIATFNHDIIITGNLSVDQGARLRLSSGASGNIKVLQNTFLGTNVNSSGGINRNPGSIEFPTGNARIFETNKLYLRQNQHNRVIVENSTDAILHTLLITGAGIEIENGTFDLFNNNTGGNNAELIFTGEEDASFIRTGGNIPRLFNLVLDKGNNQTPLLRMQTDFTLHAPTDIAQKPIQLRNGTLMLEHEDINLQMSTGGGLWQIPANAALVVNQGRVNLTANGINLRGKLRVENEGSLIMGGQNNNRIVIQYEGLTPELELTGNGRIEVNSQIRRPTNTTNGSLRYRQHGGLLIIHGANTQNSRARLEITNTGSELTISDGQIIIRRGSGNIFGDLFLNAQSFSVTGGDIWLSQGEIPAQGGFDAYPAINANYNYRVSSSGFLHNLFIGSDEDHNRRATAVLWSQPLRINNDLVFRNDLSQISTGNRDVEIKGDLHFRGSWLHENSETVSFTGINQSLFGSPEFNHMRVRTEGSLNLESDASPVIHGNLMLDQGQLVDGGNAIWVRGDVINNATLIASDPANFNSGLKLTGETTQRISGNGVFGLLEMDNVMGVNVLNDIHLNNHLILTRGVFNIGSNLLSLDFDANIFSFDAFSAENMILTDGIFGNEGGIRKSISGAASSFVFPIGVYGKYTPVDLSVFEASESGSVLVKPVNEFHPTTMDPDNVLQYYWYMESEGLDGFSGEVVMHYIDSDVRGDEENYLATRLRENIWQKFQNEAGFIYVDTDAKTIRFLFEDDNLSGEYSAGIDEAFTDSILTFTSVKSGEWTDLDLWARSDGGEVTFIPAGVNIVISEGDTVLTGGNRRQAYTVTINGRLEIDQTYGHNFGTVTGAGTLSSGRNILPAGKYSGFFNTPGNTMEYSGPLSFTIIPDYTTNFQNLTITGTGLKRLPNQTINIAGNLRISDNATVTANNSQVVNLYGNLVKGDNANLNFDLHLMRLNMTGSSSQFISGNFQGSGNNFHTLNINNPNGVTIEGSVDIAGTLALTNGILNTHNAVLRLNWANNAAIGAYSNQSHIDGPLTRRLVSGMNNLFPVGNNGMLREIRILNPNLNDLYWTAEYINGENINDPDLMNASQLSWVNANEYWKVDGANGAQARIQLTTVMDDTYPWFDHPELPDYLHVAEWSGTQWISRGQLQHSAMAGNRISVTAESFSPFSTKYFTLGQSADVDGALPIELLSFTATPDDDMVLLEWITAAEINNDFFTIERSLNGRNFEIVAVIASQAEGGFSNQKLWYSAWDTNPESGMNYYRLKQTDFDGSFEYSDVIGVYFEVQSNVLFNLFPNPNSGNGFNIILNGLRPFENLTLQIVDMFGKTVYATSERADDIGGMQAYIIPAGRLKSGIYLVTITGHSGRFTLRMVVN
jgi:hypothetical protein